MPFLYRCSNQPSALATTMPFSLFIHDPDDGAVLVMSVVARQLSCLKDRHAITSHKIYCTVFCGRFRIFWAVQQRRHRRRVLRARADRVYCTGRRILFDRAARCHEQETCSQPSGLLLLLVARQPPTHLLMGRCVLDGPMCIQGVDLFSTGRCVLERRKVYSDWR